MRKILIPGALLGALLFPGVAPGQETPRALLDRAIKAHGGYERLAKVRADKVKLQGKIVLGSGEVPFVNETTVQLPEQFKSVVQLTSEGRAHTVVHLLDGDKATILLDGKAQPVDPAVGAQMRQTLHLDQALRLVPLLSGTTYKLTSLGESPVNGRPALGLKVSVHRQEEMCLYFDKQTALLVKTVHILPTPRGKPVRQEGYYSAFRDLGGYLRPTKVSAFRDGKKVMEADLVEVKYYEKIDASEFTRP
jgi:hypothetical protein